MNDDAYIAKLKKSIKRTTYVVQWFENGSDIHSLDGIQRKKFHNDRNASRLRDELRAKGIKRLNVLILEPTK